MITEVVEVIEIEEEAAAAVVEAEVVIEIEMKEELIDMVTQEEIGKYKHNQNISHTFF